MTAEALVLPRTAADKAPPLRSRRYKRETFLAFVSRWCVVIALTVIFVGPVIFIALTAVMSNDQALTSQLWPHSWHWDNFGTVFRKAPLVRYFANTLLYAVLSTAFLLLSSIPAAYAMARLRWKGRNLAFLVVLTMMMLPPQVTTVPIYVLWSDLHLTGSLWPLILPNLFGDAFSIFLLRQFFLTIPQDYADAARIDGCSEFAVMRRVILPMAKPGIAATAMFSFFYAWNDFYGPFLYTSENQDQWTVSLGLANFKGLYQVQWNLTMAMTLLVMVPVVVVFFLAQKSFVEGVTLTGVKG